MVRELWRISDLRLPVRRGHHHYPHHPELELGGLRQSSRRCGELRISASSVPLGSRLGLSLSGVGSLEINFKCQGAAASLRFVQSVHHKMSRESFFPARAEDSRGRSLFGFTFSSLHVFGDVKGVFYFCYIIYV